MWIMRVCPLKNWFDPSKNPEDHSLDVCSPRAIFSYVRIAQRLLYYLHPFSEAENARSRLEVEGGYAWKRAKVRSYKLQ